MGQNISSWGELCGVPQQDGMQPAVRWCDKGSYLESQTGEAKGTGSGKEGASLTTVPKADDGKVYGNKHTAVKGQRDDEHSHLIPSQLVTLKHRDTHSIPLKAHTSLIQVHSLSSSSSSTSTPNLSSPILSLSSSSSNIASSSPSLSSAAHWIYPDDLPEEQVVTTHSPESPLTYGTNSPRVGDIDNLVEWHSESGGGVLDGDCEGEEEGSTGGRALTVSGGDAVEVGGDLIEVCNVVEVGDDRQTDYRGCIPTFNEAKETNNEQENQNSNNDNNHNNEKNNISNSYYYYCDDSVCRYYDDDIIEETDGEVRFVPTEERKSMWSESVIARTHTPTRPPQGISLHILASPFLNPLTAERMMSQR